MQEGSDHPNEAKNETRHEAELSKVGWHVVAYEYHAVAKMEHSRGGNQVML